MSDPELRKTVEFIIEQQAQFAADIQQLRETQAAHQEKTDERLAQAESVIVRLSDIVRRAVDATERLTELQQRADPTLSGLTDRLNALIDAVELLISRERAEREGGDAPAAGETPPNA